MSVSAEAQALAEELLTRAVEQLEDWASEGHFHTLNLRSVGGVARLAGLEPLAARCESVLSAAPDEAFFAGAITNFELPELASTHLRSLRTRDELERDFPAFVEAEVLDVLRGFGKSEPHVAAALEEDFAAAFSLCQEEQQFEEVASTQAVFGHIEAALESAHGHEFPASRANGVRYVCLLELFRRGRLAEGRKLLEAYAPPAPGPDVIGQIALVLIGRVPWRGYPYPDW